MTDSWILDALPCEVLLTIFDYCNIIDLLRLSQVCRRFHEIIHRDIVWIKKSKRSLVTNQMADKFRNRCNPMLSARDKCLISYNWQYGKYHKKAILKKDMSLPWLQMTDDMLWWCGGNYIYGIERKDLLKERSKKKNIFSNQKYVPTDFSKLVLWRNFIISSHCNGSINYWVTTSCRDGYRPRIVKRENAHSSYINAIDASSQYIISGSTELIKIHRNIGTLDDCGTEAGVEINIADTVLSLAIDPTEKKFAVGSSGFTKIPSLHINDIEYCTLTSGTVEHEWRYGAGILDMVWDNPHTLLTCGYDSHVRKWDARIGKCVSAWADPNDSSLYCIASDYQYTMVTGAQYSCMAVLWDQRQSKFAQVYYVNPTSMRTSSPVYSVRFDSSHLYCATDRYLVELNFSDHLCQEHNYKALYIRYDKRP